MALKFFSAKFSKEFSSMMLISFFINQASVTYLKVLLLLIFKKTREIQIHFQVTGVNNKVYKNMMKTKIMETNNKSL